MTKPILTGAELEALGLMKFTCDVCKDLFPVRCDAHRRLPDTSAAPKLQEPDPRQLQLLVRLERRTPKRSPIAYGAPLPDYTAPYEHLEADIHDALTAHRG
jgi:hypothetical protein